MDMAYDLCMRQCFVEQVWPIILVVIHSKGNKELNISDLVNFLVESSSPRWQTIFKLNNMVCGKSLTVTNYVLAMRILVPSLHCAPGMKR